MIETTLSKLWNSLHFEDQQRVIPSICEVLSCKGGMINAKHTVERSKLIGQVSNGIYFQPAEKQHVTIVEYENAEDIFYFEKKPEGICQVSVACSGLVRITIEYDITCLTGTHVKQKAETVFYATTETMSAVKLLLIEKGQQHE